MSKKFRKLSEILESDAIGVREISATELDQVSGAAKDLAPDICFWIDWGGLNIHVGYPMFAE